MSSPSRSSVSPYKSRSSTPLQQKSDNIKRTRSISTSPLKQHFLTKDESSKIVNSASTRATYVSPNRSPLRHTAQSPFTQLGKKPKFTIFKDETDYRKQGSESNLKTPLKVLAQTALPTPEQDDKENVYNYKQKTPIRQQSEQEGRLPLSDLDIRAYPGFIQGAGKAESVLAPRFQLTESYRPEQLRYKNLPVFVTPPRRKLQNVRYEFGSATKRNLATKLRKCASFDNRVSKPFVTKDLGDSKFRIFNDNVSSHA